MTPLTFLRLTVILVAAVLLPASAAETEWRTWTSTAGTTIDARLVKLAGGSVTLERRGGGNLSVKLSQLSADDRTYLMELPEEPRESGETKVAGIDAEPGKRSSEIQCLADERWSYHIYLPQGFHTGRKWPVWFVMSAGGGKGGGALGRYQNGADRLGCILALSVQSKNGFSDSELAIEAMADDVFTRLPVIEGLAFTTGHSGGSRMAYLLAERDKRVGGVLACASGSGVYLKEEDFRDAKLRKSTYVYSLIGSNCFNRSEAVGSHQKFPDRFRLRFIPGGHAWAGPKFVAEGMARVYGDALANHKSRELDELRMDYARTMWKWTEELKQSEPWEAAYWAGFLSDFDGDDLVKSNAAKLASELAGQADVQRAAKAEKAIQRFTTKHFNKYISTSDGKKADPAREAEAEKIAADYEGLPHAELIRKLSKPS